MYWIFGLVDDFYLRWLREEEEVKCVVGELREREVLEVVFVCWLFLFICFFKVLYLFCLDLWI